MLGEINIIAVIAATLGSFFVGFLWYGVLFMKPWMNATGMKEDDKSSMGKQIMQNQAFNIIGIAAFYYILKMMGISEMREVIHMTIILWGAFCVPSIMAGIIWEKRPFSLGLINVGAFLAQSIVAGLILSNWL